MRYCPELEERLSDLRVPYETDTLASSTLVSSPAHLVITPSTEQVAPLLAILQGEGVDYQPLGTATNTLLKGTMEHPIETILVSTCGMREIVRDGDTLIAGAGARMATLSRYAAREALTGLEFACDIPGTVAGAIATDAWHPIANYRALFEAMNIPLEGIPNLVRIVLTAAEIVGSDGQVSMMTAEELSMQDRSSILTRPGNQLFLLRAHFGLQEGDPDIISNVRTVVHEGRRRMRVENKKGNPYSVGRTLGYSFVLNHPSYGGRSANTLVSQTESLPAVVEIQGMHHSTTTPNIIGNTGHGHPNAYLAVAQVIHDSVFKEHGVDMPLEVKVIE